LDTELARAGSLIPAIDATVDAVVSPIHAAVHTVFDAVVVAVSRPDAG
jgi:hypothetical protein